MNKAGYEAMGAVVEMWTDLVLTCTLLLAWRWQEIV